MAIPDYQSFMLPLLQLASDGKAHTLREAIEVLAHQFGVTAEERRELLPSGRQATLDNRVGWAKTYLQKAHLLESPQRGQFRITARGLKVLADKPPTINVDFLLQFREFVEFRQKAPIESQEPQAPALVQEQTPQELLELSYQTLRTNLAQELLERIKKCSPAFFEQLVVDLLVAMGYGGSRRDAGQAIGRSGDGGIDGIIKEDRLGLDVVYIQAKRWEDTVSRPLVQAFAGSLEGYRARKGVMITTSQFSPQAIEYVGRIEKKIVLIGGEQLAQFMIDYDVGVAEEGRYVVKKLDLDYFGEG